MNRRAPPARKRFGQHFLEPAWVDKVIRAIDPKADDIFIEIGPGRGALTRPLAARARAVVAYEIDRDLVAALRASAPPNVIIVEGDFLAAEPEALARPSQLTTHDFVYRIAGNLPYNVASPILFKLIELSDSGRRFRDATVMLQREVADRLSADRGSRDYGVLTVLVGHQASVRPLLQLPPGAFRPTPKVHSALLRVTFHPPEPAPADPELFRRVVQTAFTRRRKTLANALGALASSSPLSPAEAARRAGIDPGRRPETLSISEWVRLSDVLARLAQVPRTPA